MPGPTTRDMACPTCGVPKGKACRSGRGKPLSDEHTARRLISVREAANQGITRLRKPIWANPFDHLKIDLPDGELGPWVHFYSPANLSINGRDPVDILIGTILTPAVGLDSPEFKPYTGPLLDSEAYQKEVSRFGRFPI